MTTGQAAVTHLGVKANWTNVVKKVIGGTGSDTLANYIVNDLGIDGPIALARFFNDGGEGKGAMLVTAINSPPAIKKMITGAEEGTKNFYMEPPDVQPLTPMQQINLMEFITTCAFYKMVRFATNDMYEPDMFVADKVSTVSAQMNARKAAFKDGADVSFTTYTKNSERSDTLDKFQSEADRQKGSSAWINLGAYLRPTEKPRRAPLQPGTPWSKYSNSVAEELKLFGDLDGPTNREDKTELLATLRRVYKRLDDLDPQMREFQVKGDVRGAFELLKRELQSKEEHRKSFKNYKKIYDSFWNPESALQVWIGNFKKSYQKMDAAAKQLPEQQATLEAANKLRFLNSLGNCTDSAIISKVASLRTNEFETTTLEQMFITMSALDPNNSKESVTNSTGGAICSYVSTPVAANSSKPSTATKPKVVVGFKYPGSFRKQYLSEAENNALKQHVIANNLNPGDMPSFKTSTKATNWVKAKGGAVFLNEGGGGGRGGGGRGGPGRDRGRSGADKRRFRGQDQPREGSPEKKQRAQIAELIGSVKVVVEASEQMAELVEQQNEKIAALETDPKTTKKKVTISAVTGKVSEAGASIREKLRAVRLKGDSA